jgi:hypothetical protein
VFSIPTTPQGQYAQTVRLQGGSNTVMVFASTKDVCNNGVTNAFLEEEAISEVDL